MNTPIGERIPDEILDHVTGGIDRDAITQMPGNIGKSLMEGIDVVCPYCKNVKTSFDDMICPACKEMLSGNQLKSLNFH